MESKRLEIGNLNTVKEISERISFLQYSTQKRNLIYNIQYHKFMVQLHNNYKMYGSVKAVFVQQLVILSASICESFLYCYLKQLGYQNIKGEKRRKVKFNRLINLAREGKGEGGIIISKQLRKDLDTLNSNRNQVHPDSQRELSIKVFTTSKANQATKTVRVLNNELSLHHEEVVRSK